MAKFCEMCGTPLDPETGICPNCGNTANAKVNQDADAPNVIPETPNEAGSGPSNDIAADDVDKTVSLWNRDPVSVGFCDVCGCPLDPATGKCPNCSAEKPLNAESSSPLAAPAAPAVSGAPEKEKKAKKAKKEKAPRTPGKKKKKNPGITVLVVFLFILFIAFSLVCLSLFIVRNTLTGDNVEKAVKEVSFKDITSSLDSSTNKQIDKFATNISDSLKNNNYPNAEWLTINRKTLGDVYNKSTLKKLIIKKAKDFVDDFFNEDSASVRLTRDEIVSFLENNNNRDIIREKTGVDVYQYLEYPDEYGNRHTIGVRDKLTDLILGKEKDKYVLFDSDSLSGDGETAYKAVKFVLSWVAIVLLAVICAVLAVLMFILRPSLSAMCIGIYFILLGLPLTVAGLGAMFPDLISGIVGNDLIGIGVSVVLKANLLVGLILLVVGILLIVGRCVIRSIIRKKENRRAAAAA